MNLRTRLQFLLIYLTHLVGCGPVRSELDQETRLQLEQLREHLKEQYLRKSEQHLGSWPSDQDCDGALWAGVARAAGLAQVQVQLGLTPEGRPTRRPGQDCGPKELGFNGGAACTTSTDMMTGLILGLNAARDLPSLEKLRDYSDRHRMVMGTPEHLISRSVMKPGTRALLSQAIRNLGGKTDAWVHVGQVYLPPLPDYELHLELLTLSFEQKLGTMTRAKQAVLQLEADLNPRDALAQALAGRLAKAADLLLSPDWTPPGYVRGPDLAGLVHRLFVLAQILDTPSNSR